MIHVAVRLNLSQTDFEKGSLVNDSKHGAKGASFVIVLQPREKQLRHLRGAQVWTACKNYVQLHIRLISVAGLIICTNAVNRM
jgi:hypothetical protein